MNHEGAKNTKEEGRRKIIFILGREYHQSGDKNVDGFPQMVILAMNSARLTLRRN
jgi:hypothetical protein